MDAADGLIVAIAVVGIAVLVAVLRDEYVTHRRRRAVDALKPQADNDVTPVEIPTVEAQNRALVDVIREARYETRSLADAFGDLERTIRLASMPVSDGQREGMAKLFDRGVNINKVAAQRVRDTKGT